MGWLARYLILWLGLCMASAAWPAALDVQDRSSLPIDSATRWCATPADVSIDDVLRGVCALQPLQPSSVVQGWDNRAFWMRVDLLNSDDMALERWLEIGYPQMAYISMYVPTADGWTVHQAGAGVAFDTRGPIERQYGVFAVPLAANSEKVVWLRIASDTIISLRGTLWAPDEFRLTLQRRHFWGSMAMGGVCLTVLFSLLMLALTRQSAYGFFALGLIGQFVNLSVPSGIFQRFLWPHDVPLFSVVRELGALVAVFGMYRFLRVFLPNLSRYPVLLGVFRAAVWLAMLVILVDVVTPWTTDRLWFVTAVLCSVFGMMLCARAWRDGDRAAGIILLAFCNFFGMACLRLLAAFGSVHLVPEATMLPVLAIFLGSPLILLGLVDRTRQLRDDLLRVQAESAAQLRFLAQMSHELRSPLDNILGNAQLMAREARSAAQTNGLNSIFDSGRQLLRIIDHILEYARGSAGMLRIDPAPLRLDTFLRGIERMSRLLAVQRNNRFVLQLEGDPQVLAELSVMADAERLRQVLVNLLGNAARHTGDGVLTLQVEALPLEGVRMNLAFSVSDTGEGIALKEQERIFHPFERAISKASYGGKGAGLGLAIARQLVELMGGRLTVRSVPGQGATFRFWIPVQRLPQDYRVSPELLEGFDAAGYLGARRTVLVVDDSEASRAVLSGLLEGLGFRVFTASSGTAAAALLPGLDGLDLVLTDQYMPDGDGWQVLETVGTRLPEVPVVLISAAPPSPPPGWSGGLRFDAQFLRPLDHALLLACIGDLLDLTWSEIASSEPASYVPALATAAVSAPGIRDLRTLVQLVELGQVTAVQEWALRLKGEQPQHTDFADQVIDAVRRLDLDALVQLASDSGLQAPGGRSG